MSIFNIFFHKASKQVTVQAAGAPAPADSVQIGEHDHPDDKNIHETHGGRTLYEIIRGMLHLHGQTNMQEVGISVSNNVGTAPVPSTVGEPMSEPVDPTPLAPKFPVPEPVVGPTPVTEQEPVVQEQTAANEPEQIQEQAPVEVAQVEVAQEASVSTAE